MTNYEILTIIVSTLAVIVSTVSLVRTRKITLKQLELEKATSELSKKQLEMINVEELAAQKAKIDAEFKKEQGAYKFVIKNIGKATAKNIRFGFSGHGYPFSADEFARKIPIKELRPGKFVNFISAKSARCAHEYTISLLWENPDGSQERDEVIATW